MTWRRSLFAAGLIAVSGLALQSAPARQGPAADAQKPEAPATPKPEAADTKKPETPPE